MSICSNCKSESLRVRSRWTEKNERLPDECPQCAPESFGKVTDPSDKKIWMGWEAHPNEYVGNKSDGFDRKPEYRAEQEARLCQSSEDEREAQRKAEEKKRKERRTRPMDSVELAAAMKRAEEVASFVVAAAMQGTDVN